MKQTTTKVMDFYSAAMAVLSTIVLITAIDLAYKGILSQTKEHVAIGILVTLGYSASFIAFVKRKSF